MLDIHGEVGVMGGFRIVEDVSFGKKYPSGKKDGNKLGRRKREMIVK